MSNYLDMNPGRYKRVGMAVGAGVLGVGIIGGGILTAKYALGEASDKIFGMYHDWKGDAVPKTFPLVEVQKTMNTLDEVIKEGEWKLSSGVVLKVERETGGVVQSDYREDLKIYETEDKKELEKKKEEKKE
ncbi:hypothetical protein HZA99_06210 [Candidatus Woesearchaeota archaeon]|nr:hypothetical protein [Candidatus Woesearchaeota archaeon]